MADETKQDFTATELLMVPKLKLLTYVDMIAHIAQDVEVKYYIPYMIPIIQSAHESAYGNSGLARNHCNLFGMKVNKSWLAANKPVANMKTGEHINGKDIIEVQPFKKYQSWRESFDDWGRLISTAPAYTKAYTLFKAKDALGGIQAMASAYATDTAYAKKLVELYHYLVQG